MIGFSNDEEVLLLYHLGNKKKRRYWVSPLNMKFINHSINIVVQELHPDPEKFKSFYRIKKANFEYLVTLIGQHITKKSTNYTQAIASEKHINNSTLREFILF